MKIIENRKRQLIETIVVVIALVALWACFNLGKNYRKPAIGNTQTENVRKLF